MKIIIIFALLVSPIAHAAETEAKEAMAFCVKAANSAGVIKQIFASDSLATFKKNVNNSKMSDVDKVMNIAIAKEVYATIPTDTSAVETSQIIFDRCISQFGITKILPPAEDRDKVEFTL